MSDHGDYRYSITIQSDDLAVINCLRSLAQFSQKTGNNRISWGGTKDSDWKRAGGKVTFRFSSASYREGFKGEIARLLPDDLLVIVGEREDDPATSQRR